MKRLLLLFTICLLQSGCIPALVTKAPGAYGIVTDSRTHSPVADAAVTFPGRSPVVMTDADGKYDLPHTDKFGIIVLLPVEFQSLPLQISHPHYQTKFVRVYTNSKHLQQDVALDMMSQ